MKFEPLNTRTAGATIVLYYVLLASVIIWKAWQTGAYWYYSLLAVLFFVNAGIGFVIWKRNEDGDKMRFSMMQLLTAMTIFSLGLAYAVLRF
jgi:hypothetical protein